MRKRIAVAAAAVGLLLPLSATPAQADPIDDVVELISDAGCTTVYVAAIAASAPGNPQVYEDENGNIVVSVDPGDPNAMQRASEDYAACVG